MQLLQSEQLIEVLDLVTYAQLIIAVFNMCQHQVHQLPEYLLVGGPLFCRVTDEGHHDVEAELVLDFQLQRLVLDLFDDRLLSINFELDPA